MAELLRPKTLPFIVVVGENLKETVSDSDMCVTGPGWVEKREKRETVGCLEAEVGYLYAFQYKSVFVR